MKLNYEIGLTFQESNIYINELDKLEKNIDTTYNPDTANRELPNYRNAIKDLFIEFVNLIKEKEKFKIK